MAKARKSRKRRHPVFQTLHQLRYAAAVGMLDLLRWVFSRLPHRFALNAGRGIGWMVWLCSPPLRRLAIRQLTEACVGKHGPERRRIVRQMFCGLGANVCEWLHASDWTQEDYRRRIRLAEGTTQAPLSVAPCVIVTGHIGNWELLPGVFKAYGGPQSNIVMRAQRSPVMNRWLVRRRAATGHGVLFERDGMLQIFRGLRQGKPVALLADQDSRQYPGIYVPFFDRPARTPEGPARIAVRAGVPILPMALLRDPECPAQHVLHIGALLQPDPAADPAVEVQRLTQAYTLWLEGIIRREPSQWVWVHRRWRHRPPGAGGQTAAEINLAAQ